LRCFTATYKNKKLQHVALLLSALLQLAESSKGFQAGLFNFAQMKASVDLCINKLSDAAAKSEIKAMAKILAVNLGYLECRMVWLHIVAFWKGTERLAD